MQLCMDVSTFSFQAAYSPAAGSVTLTAIYSINPFHCPLSHWLFGGDIEHVWSMDCYGPHGSPQKEWDGWRTSSKALHSPSGQIC